VRFDLWRGQREDVIDERGVDVPLDRWVGWQPPFLAIGERFSELGSRVVLGEQMNRRSVLAEPFG
jgi:hypothetical protein